MKRVHGSCVALDGAGVLLRGPSGSGKSDLALRLIEAGARLVADDQVELHEAGDGLLARPPATIAGLLEVRGLGIARLDFVEPAPLVLVADLADAPLERMPEATTIELFGRVLPWLAINPWELSAPAKVRLAVLAAKGNIMLLR